MRWIVCVLLVSCSILSCAQPLLRFKTLTTKQGLSQNSVNEIFEDSKGYLWIATQDGLNRYDGREFIKYNAGFEESRLLSDNFLWDVQEDNQGNIWVASRDGINRIDVQNATVTQLFPDTSGVHRWGNVASTLKIFKDTVHVVFHTNYYRFHVNEYTGNSRLYLPEERRLQGVFDTLGIHDLLLTSNGRFIRTGQGLAKLADDGISSSVLPKPLTSISQGNALYMDNAERIWVGGAEGLWYLENNEWKELKWGGRSLQNIHSIVQDKEGIVWVGTATGLYLFTNDLERLFFTRTSDDQGKEKTYDLIHALGLTEDGTVWIGTANTGLKYFHWSQEQFKYLSKEDLSSSPLVWSSRFVDDSTFLVGTNNGIHLFRYTESNEYLIKPLSTVAREVSEPWMDQVGAVRALALLATEEEVWIGSAGQGVFICNRRTGSVRNIVLNDERSHAQVVSELVREGNFIWAVTQFGLYKLSTQGDIVKAYYDGRSNWTAPASYFIAATNDGQGSIWFGSNYGCSRYIIKDSKFVHYLHDKNEPSRGPGFNFTSGFVRDGNTVWIGTYGGGLSQLDLSTSVFTHYTNDEGLSNNVCSGIVGDGKGKLWIATNAGLDRFDTETKTFAHFGISKGLIDSEFTLNSIKSNSNGKITVGSPSGLVLFDPTQLKTNEFVGQGVIQRIEVNYEEVDPINQLDLYSSDKSLVISFAALAYWNVEDYRFEYRLIGYDDKWVDANPADLRAIYTSLPYGKYTFQIRVCNDDERCVESDTLVSLEMHPPIWLRWWFITAMGLGLLLVVVLTVRFLARRKLKKRLEEINTQRKLQAERERISRDLHDNVGAQLTYIISSLDNAAYKTNSIDGQVSGQLDELSDFSRNTMQQLRESIWVINSEEITLEEFQQRVLGLGSKLLPPDSEIQLKVNLHGDASRVLNPSRAIHLLRIVQESVNNSIKHSECSLIEATLIELNGKLQVKVVDNGNGVDAVQEKEGHNGLANMKERGRIIEANVEISSAKGKGYEVVVEDVELE